MRIIVTGGSGFIGSRVVRNLVEKGHEVVSIDILQPNVAPIDYQHETCDLLDFPWTKSVINNADVVYHIAGVVLEYIRKNPFVGSGLNINMTRNVVEACRLNGISKVIFASSFYVYDGIPSSEKVNEETPLAINDMELFGATKVLGETLIREYNRTYGLEYAILRFGSAYGSGNCTNVVKEFLETGWASRTIEVWGPGNRSNQYTYVDDIAEGAALSINSTNRVFNLISPEETTVKNLTEYLSKQYGFPVSFRLDKKEGASMPKMLSQRAMDELAWKPRRLTEGIAEMVRDHELVSSALKNSITS